MMGLSKGADVARRYQNDASNTAVAKPASGLSAAIMGARENLGHASRLLGRLIALNDAVGGSTPATDSAEGKSLPAMGHIGQLNETNTSMSSVLSSIEEELRRLEGLVG